ncbi:MAG: rhodanese-like domain-containing protein [Anaerolineales bacterium]
MNKKIVIISFILVNGFILTACAGSVFSSGNSSITYQNSYSNITPEELNDMVVNKDFLLINVHVPFSGDIPDTDLSIPYDQIDQQLDKLPADKAAKIVVYCRSGSMSAVAAENLISLGYTNVLNLENGFYGWENAGFPLEEVISE